MEGFLYFFMGLGTGRIPVTDGPGDQVCDKNNNK